MKNIKKINKTFCFLILILLVSCYGEPDLTILPNNKLMTFGDFTSEMSKLKGSGTILIQSNDYVISQENPKCINISERLGKPNSIKFFDSNNQIVNVLGCPENLKSSLFGNNLNYSILNDATKSIYIPQLLKVNFSSNQIYEGLNITWNADILNFKGIVIWITYKPTNQLYTIAKNNMNYITHGIVTGDNGLYTITQKDLERFPDKSQVCINILRTNFETNTLDKPSLIAFTTISNDFFVKK